MFVCIQFNYSRLFSSLRFGSILFHSALFQFVLFSKSAPESAKLLPPSFLAAFAPPGGWGISALPTAAAVVKSCGRPALGVHPGRSGYRLGFGAGGFFGLVSVLGAGLQVQDVLLKGWASPFSGLDSGKLANRQL